MTKHIVLALGLSGLLAVVAPAAFAAKTPQAMATDSRVRQVVYDQNQIYHITGTYGYQTLIELSSEETIKVVTLGDTIAWQTVPYQNRLFIKPVETNAQTNLTVITDKRTYYFHLDSAKKTSQMTYLVRFMYPRTALQSFGEQAGSPAGQQNSDYGASGDRTAIPVQKVFDDGQFTYFLFAANAEIPAVYAVGRDGTESIVNTRREGDYLVAETVHDKFTLRNGSAYLCIRNNRLVTAPQQEVTDYHGS